MNDYLKPSFYFEADFAKLYLSKEEEFFLFEACEGKFLIPLIFRPLENGWWDAISSYGYSGVYASPELTEKELRDAWNKFLIVLEERRIVSVFFRQNNLISNSQLKQQCYPGLDLVEVSKTYLINLFNDNSLMWSQMEGRSRTSIRKAEKAELQFEIEPLNLDASQKFNMFQKLYFETMDRRSADKFYRFDDEYFLSLSKLISPKTFIASVNDKHGDALSSCLVLADDEMLHYHLSGSSRAAGQIGANNLLIWGIQQWGARFGYKSLHLGGGVKSGDSLSKFKKQFGGSEIPYFVGKVIANSEQYSSLSKKNAEKLQVDSQILENIGFFPIYRIQESGVEPK